MNLEHKNTSKTWLKRPFLEQMANIGSEVERTIAWKEKGNLDYSEKAFARSLELFDFTLDSDLTASQLKEVARARELWVDFIKYGNNYNQVKEQWRKYFFGLLYLYRMRGN